jgi:hypothetical protein
MLHRVLRRCFRWGLRGVVILLVVLSLLVALSNPMSKREQHQSNPRRGVALGLHLALWNAVKLELRVWLHPSDVYARSILVGLYSVPSVLFGPAADRLFAHCKWMVENNPSSSVPRYWCNVPGREAEMGEVWKLQVQRAPTDIDVLYNAAVGVSDPQFAEGYLLKILRMNPKSDEAHHQLGVLYEHDGPRVGIDQHTALVRAFEEYQAAAKLSDNDGDLSSAAQMALELGDLETAENYATRLLAPGREHAGWPANAIHDGNTILGRIAMRRGDIDRAKNHLVAAGRVDGSESGTLTTFGPSMALAKELLDAGEKEVVLDYFTEVSRFWQEGCHGSLEGWEAAIRAGRKPNFGNQVLY